MLRAVAEAMFAGGRAPLAEGQLSELVMRVDRMLGAASPFVRTGMRFAMLVLWFSPLLLGMHLRTLPRLSIAERTDVLRALEHSRFTNLLLVFVGVRAMLTMIFYEDAEELAHMGYSATHQTRFDRTRAKRQLPVLAAVPVPLESGVRLKEGREEAASLADESGEHATTARPAAEDVA